MIVILFFSSLTKLQASLAEHYELLTAARGSYKALPGRSAGLGIKWSLSSAIFPSSARSKAIVLLFQCMSADNVGLLTAPESVFN